LQKPDKDIHHRSSTGIGTVFTIILQVIENPTTLPESSVLHLKNSGKGVGNVLVMDDEEVIRNLAMQLGYVVIVCANGEDAIELYGAAFGVRYAFSCSHLGPHHTRSDGG
jgi:hypothetical protein